MFVAVQRITTARWSRAVIRLHGRLRRVPARRVRASCCSRSSSGKGHIFPWTHEAPPNPEKATYFNGAFLTIRDIVVVRADHVRSLWYIYTSVRLDVGLIPEWGAKWAAGLRARMRNGFGEERREIHSTHSLQGKLAVFAGRCCSRSAGRCCRGICRWACRCTSRARCTAGGSSWAAGSARSCSSRCSSLAWNRYLAAPAV